MLKTEGASFSIGKSQLLRRTTVDFKKAQFHVIMGPNGAGKSTLLKLLAGEYKPSTGTVFFNGEPLQGLSKSMLATRRAVLSQHYHLAFPISVQEVVLMGRYPYFSSQPTAEDWSICEEAMKLMDVHHLAERDYTTLSGGEAQKVQMSRVLAQIWTKTEDGEKVLFLDEPVSHLDIKYQYQVLRIAKDLCAKGTTIIAVLHDMNIALAFADALYLMKDAELVHTLHQPESITPEMVQQVFGVLPRIFYPDGAKPVLVF